MENKLRCKIETPVKMEARCLLLMTCCSVSGYYPLANSDDLNRFAMKKLSSNWTRLRAARYKLWDSNAETARTRRFNFNLRNYDVEDEQDDNDAENDYYFSSRNQESGLLQEVFQNIFIFKVLRSYGWSLPFVLLSLLAISGPKAFFLSLAVCLGVSALAFAADKLLQGPPRTRPRRKYRRTGGRRSPRQAGFRSWGGGNRDDSAEQGGGRDAPSFGGWGELDKGMDTMGSTKRPAQRSDGLRRKKADQAELSWEEKSDIPLLLRLLVAAFPFLG